MMPICSYKTLRGRCQDTATEKIGTIAIPDANTGDREPWTQPHYLCRPHQIKLLQRLGLK